MPGLLGAQGPDGASSPKIFWTDANFFGSAGARVWRMNPDGSGIQPLIVPGGLNTYFLAVDPGGGKIYWADNSQGPSSSISRSNLDGTGVEVLTRDVSCPMGVAVDPVDQKLYWTDCERHTVMRSNLDGSGAQTLLTIPSTPFIGSPQGIAFDVIGRKVYWANTDQGAIQRANPDGTVIQTVVQSLSFPQGVSLDHDGGKIYWTDGFGVRRANFDGTGVETVAPSDVYPIGVAVDPAAGKVYWTGLYPSKIQRANGDGSVREDLLTQGLDTPWGIAIVTAVPVSSDATPPDTEIKAGPEEGSTTGTSAGFEFDGSDDTTQPSDLIFECSLDGS